MNSRISRGVYIILLAVLAPAVSGEIFLPGMQPEEAGIEFAKVQQCRMCHGQTKNGDADPMLSWQGGMMAQAARDPIFLATMTIANQDVPGVGEFCLRCHTPRGWLEGRSTPADASALNREDLYGVSCDVCHRFIDPLSEEAKKLIKDVPPGYGNAMMVADPENRVRMTSPTRYWQRTSGHSRFTPTGISNAHTANGCSATMPNRAGKVPASPVITRSSRAAGRPRAMAGCIASISSSTARLWPTADVDKKALQLGKERCRALLKTAAKLDLDIVDNKARLRITNLTGHKLPSGYPEGRRMWVNVRFLADGDRIVKEIGAYGEKQDTLGGEPVKVPTLLDGESTTVYEVIPGISEGMAKKFNKTPGPSFHFVLNDMITKDNRIPPKGFDNRKFAEHLCEPVGKTYADGQYWDDLEFDIPQGTRKVHVRLMYQSRKTGPTTGAGSSMMSGQEPVNARRR